MVYNKGVQSIWTAILFKRIHNLIDEFLNKYLTINNSLGNYLWPSNCNINLEVQNNIFILSTLFFFLNLVFRVNNLTVHQILKNGEQWWTIVIVHQIWAPLKNLENEFGTNLCISRCASRSLTSSFRLSSSFSLWIRHFASEQVSQ